MKNFNKFITNSKKIVNEFKFWYKEIGYNIYETDIGQFLTETKKIIEQNESLYNIQSTFHINQKQDGEYCLSILNDLKYKYQLKIEFKLDK